MNCSESNDFCWNPGPNEHGYNLINNRDDVIFYLRTALAIFVVVVLCSIPCKYCWLVFANFCNGIGKVRRAGKLDCSRCLDFQRINNCLEKKKLNQPTCDDVKNIVEKHLIRDAEPKCNWTKAMFKKLLEDSIIMRLELVSAKKKLYQTQKRMKTLEKSLLNASELANRSHEKERPYQSAFLNKLSPNKSNIKRRSSFFSSTFAHPNENSSAHKSMEESIWNDLTKKLAALEEQVGLLKEMHETEASVFEQKLTKKKEMISCIDKLKEECSKLIDDSVRQDVSRLGSRAV